MDRRLTRLSWKILYDCPNPTLRVCDGPRGYVVADTVKRVSRGGREPHERRPLKDTPF